MDNHTLVNFQIMPFSTRANDKPLIVGIFLALYLIGMFFNSVVIAVICLDVHLHNPMYLFFCSLSMIDICYTTVVIPKLLHILFSGNDLLSPTQCFAQIYFFLICASSEVLILFIMGFDRYVAICHPLTYHQILSKKICILIMVLIWISALLNASIFVTSVLNLLFYEVMSIQNVFCDPYDIFQASCGSSHKFFILVYAEIAVFGVCPIFCNFLSYVKIISVILCIKSKKGRRKTFSTCLSHLIVMSIYYSAGLIEYMVPFTDHTVIIKQIVTVFYIIVVPMVNPLIYSLRNHNIMEACKKLLKIK